MLSFAVLCLLLGAGHILRVRVRLLQRLYLPSCVVGGLLGILIVQTFAAMAGLGEPIGRINGALSQWSKLWSDLPRFLINIVFACLFLGVKLPTFKTLWRSAGRAQVLGGLARDEGDGHPHPSVISDLARVDQTGRDGPREKTPVADLLHWIEQHVHHLGHRFFLCWYTANAMRPAPTTRLLRTTP